MTDFHKARDCGGGAVKVYNGKLVSFELMWISKEENAENGPSIIRIILKLCRL